uniref:Uncharacterized protein n=1 Tax=Leptocylindrus danicus TaxID=163516 RepID=A0A7S2L6K7_9STRA
MLTSKNHHLNHEKHRENLALVWKCQRDDYPSPRSLSNIPNKYLQLRSNNTIMNISYTLSHQLYAVTIVPIRNIRIIRQCVSECVCFCHTSPLLRKSATATAYSKHKQKTL